MYPCTACANYSLDRSLSRVSRPNGPRANNCHGRRLALIRHWFVASLCCIETRPRATFRHGSFLWPILSCIIRRFGYLQNMATSLWNVAAKAQTLDLENFATASWWCGQQYSSTVKSVDYSYDGRARRGWMHGVYCTLVDCNPLSPSFWFVLDLLYNLFLHCCATVCKILTDTSRRAVRLR